MQLQTHDNKNALQVNESVFGVQYNESLIHQAVTTFMNNARSGNSAQKTRSEVRGGGRKPWKQKGTGRARAGTIRSPLWRGGGIVFAAKKRSYTQKINKKMYAGALRSILSELNRSGRLLIVNNFLCDTHKTQDFLAKMAQLGLKNALLVLENITENEYLATRNLATFEVTDVIALDPVILLKYETVLMTEGVIRQLEESLQ
jgi:large subunit ribosomal protein L4